MDAKGAFESIDAKGLLIHRFDMYRCTDTRPVRALASKWDSNRSRNQFHIHQPTFTNDGTNNVKQSDEISVPSSPSKEQEIYHHDYIEDPEYFEKSEQQLTASRERRKEANKERARIGQKTDIIIELLTGPALICEVSGGLPKKMTDKVDGRHEGYD
ncbi:hypothetical protein RhiirC2_712687 [Rhizophagus irregularis]|uniref:Uncharacterized protein n=1 Tax=Rhizophagus irregularis TaxID=588596 RepID=A0A2N1N671_9GLOM|nr:hypothetical protein RhiirC2_712687 [Rhizophagus irregularis]